MNNSFHLNKIAWILLLLTVLFISTRFGAFTRGFASEETFQVMPGRYFAEGKGFLYYYGETHPELRALYGHPPLTYLISGLMSHWGHDVTAGARLLPFLCGLAVCLAPFILTGTIASSLLILLSPFFYSAANHVQTDPTFGVLGFTLLCTFIYLYFKDFPRSHSSKSLFTLLIGTFIILFLTKTVTAAMAVFIIGCLVVFVPKEFYFTYLVRLIFASIIGFGSYILVVYLTATLSGSPLGLALEAPFTLIKALVGKKLEINASNPQSAWDDRYAILRLLIQQRAVQLFSILIVSSSIVLFWNRTKVNWKIIFSLLITSFVPLFTYFYVAYTGDGYPRYFLICFPPLFILLGYGLALFESRKIVFILTSLIFLSGCFFMGDRTWKMFNETGSVTVLPNREQGSKEAYQTIYNLTQPNDLILCYDQGILYLPNRKLLVVQDFYIDSSLYERVENIAKDLKAALIFQSTLESTSERDQFLIKLVNSLVEKGAVRYAVGDFYMYVLPTSGTVQ